MKPQKNPFLSGQFAPSNPSRWQQFHWSLSKLNIESSIRHSLKGIKQTALLAFPFSILLLTACQTDQAAQQQINQMRADNVALMDHYVSLRSYTEKLQKQLAEEGKELPKGTKPLSSLPLVYPPPGTNPRLIDQYAPDYHSSSLNPSNHSAQSPTKPNGADQLAQIPVIDQTENLRSGNPQYPVSQASFSNSNSVLENGNGEVKFITVQSTEHHGYEIDEIPGDDGIKLTLQPRDQQGNLILTPAKVQLELIDTSQVDGSQFVLESQIQIPGKRIGKWVFHKQHVEKFIRKSQAMNKQGQTQGIPLKVNLGGILPKNEELLAVVTYQYGNKNLSTKEIVKLDLTGLKKNPNSKKPITADIPAVASPDPTSWSPTRR